MRIVVLDAFAADQGTLAWDKLATLGKVAVYPRTLPQEILERAADADAALTNKVRFTAETLDALPRLRYLGIVATGTNVVDLEACRRRRIAVTNVPGYCASSVAQFVFASILHLLYDVGSYVEQVKANRWADAPDYCFFLRSHTELLQKSIAILGLGSIGAKVADIARALGMNVLAASVPGGTVEGRVPLETALPMADVVSLHCPLTERTQKLVDRKFLAAMKPGALLVNTSRGALVDEAALRDAVAEGRLGGALLDVLTEEPPPRDHPLLDPRAPWARRVVVTPHIAWGTIEARRRLIDLAAENLAAFLRGAPLNRLD